MIELLDITNREFKYMVIEGGDLGDVFKFITNTIKIEPNSNGGSVYKCHAAYHLKSDYDRNKSLNEIIKQAKERSKTLFRAVEAHLLANPDQHVIHEI